MRRDTIIRIRDLSRVFIGAVEIWALNEVTFGVDRGEFVAVLGPAGAGKSTLLHLIGGLDRPTLGAVTVDGVNPATLKGNALADWRRQTIGYAFQAPRLLSTLTLIENVMLPVWPYRRSLGFDLAERARWLLSSIGLLENAEVFPTSISPGQQQGVAVARAAVARPQVLLLDEPAALDGGIGTEILNLLDRLNRQEEMTVIVATRHERIAEFADRIVRLDGGRLSGQAAREHSRWRPS